MNTTIDITLRLTKAIAEINPFPLLRLWKAISETQDTILVRDSWKIVSETLTPIIATSDKETIQRIEAIEPYDLNESTLIDQIIVDIGENK